MKNQFIGFALAFLLFSVSGPAFSDEGLWRQLNNTTWHRDNGWAGAGLVFYETVAGAKKAILQTYGSGLPVVRSVIYDIKMEGNLILSAGNDEKLFEVDIAKKTISGVSGSFVFARDTPLVCGICGDHLMEKLIDDKIDRQTADCLRMEESAK